MISRSTTFRVTIASVILIIAAGLSAALLAQDNATSEPNVQRSDVFSFSDGSQVEDAFAQLTRFDNGATMAISTSDLQEGDVYTVWWVIFNAPENCSDGVCDADDLLVVEDGVVPRDESGNRVMNMEGIEATNASLIHAAGGYATDGTLNTSASLGEGSVAGILLGPGLLDAETAEIHLVVRTHGPADETSFAEQLSTFGGGCEPMDAPPCDDVQYAIFTPPM